MTMNTLVYLIAAHNHEIKFWINPKIIMKAWHEEGEGYFCQVENDAATYRLNREGYLKITGSM